MPSATPAELGRLALDAAVRAAWGQWTTLGASGGGAPAEDEGSTPLLDPEALLLASLAVLPHERRLADFLLWWAGVGAPLLSVQRSRSLLERFPPASAEGLGAFAASALQAGDRRWKRLAGEAGLYARPGKGAAHPALNHPTALLLRLRAGVGLSAKTDLLAVLLTLRRPASVRALADATAYSPVAVRAALGEMALARLVEPSDGHPAAYRIADAPAWAGLLTPAAPLPRWLPWADAFPALLAIAEWGRRAEADGWSPYVASSKARDLAERHAAAFRHLAPEAPRLGDLRGEAALPAFEDAVRALVGAAGAAG